jgi:signal transduction histidine kinase
MLMLVSTSLPSRWSRDLLFHLAGCVSAFVALVLWSTAVPLSLGLAIVYVGVLLGFATLLACRWFARFERRRAAIVLGAPIPERYKTDAGGRWTAQLRALLGDATTWRDFGWAGLAGIVALPLSSLAVTLWGLVAGLVTLPLWYWSLPDSANVGVANIDTLPRALAAAGAGLLLIPVTGWVVRGLTVAELGVMRALLCPRGEADAGDAPEAGREATPQGVPLPPLSAQISFSLLLGGLLAIIWAATGLGYFWPIWAWLGLAILLALRVLALRARQAESDPVAALRVKAELGGVVAAVCWIVWALSGGGYLWPFWPMLGIATALAARALVVYRDRLPWSREQALVQRVDVLERTRQGALDVQAAELRRIERDLHDGAQARLVALTMRLGRAEERLADQPEIAALVRGAREDAGLAIAELRDLARGIAPPILADRGLAAAVEALGRRSPMPVTVDADPDQRPLPVVETAAYFVVAESLTNVAKHAGGAPARVRVRRDGDALVIDIDDDGPGGADPGGGGLTGLRHRVQALDGTLTVTSPAGEGTHVHAEMPCGQ